MRFGQSFILVLLLCGGFDAGAQEPEQMPAVPEQWQLTLDVIKSKAQTLLVENDGLQVQYQQLIGQVQQLQRSIGDQKNKNEQLARLIKERHGRTDQQARIEELNRIISVKKQQARAYDEQLGRLQRKKSDLDQKIQQLKYTISDIELHQQAQHEQATVAENTPQPKIDDQLIQLRKQLEDQNKQEVLLENELGTLKTGGKTQDLNVDALDSENRQLEAHLDILRLQKLQHEKRSSDTTLAQANGRMFDTLKRRKEILEAKIYAYEMRLDQLRESSLMAMSWQAQKKKLVHEMVQTDARNNQMRDKIKVLREDIDILRDQVAKLERRVDFVKGKDATFVSTP